MIIKRIFFFVLIAITLGTIAGADLPASSEAEAFLRNIKGSLISFTGNEMILDVINQNPPETPLPDRVKHFKRFLVIVPENTNAALELDSARFALYEENRKIEEVRNGDKRPYKIPASQELITYKQSGVFRSWNLASIDVLVAQPIMVDKTNRMLRLMEANFRIRFSESQAIEAPVMEPDPLAEDVLTAIALNPKCMASYRLIATPKPEEFESFQSFVRLVNDALTSGPAVKLIVYHEGLYGVSSQELEQAGVPVNALNPRNMVLYHKNRQVPIYLDAKDRNTFPPNSKFYFYASSFPSTTPYEAYWLLYEKYPERIPPRRLSFPATQEEGVSQDKQNIFKAENKARFFPKKYYYHKMPLPRINDNWYWDEIKRGHYSYYHVDITCVDKDASTFDLTVHLSGPTRLLDNYCEVFWNNYSVGSFKWYSLENNTIQKRVPVSYLKEGDNELVLYVPPRSEQNQSSSIYFIGFEVGYSMKLSNDYGPMTFAIKKPPERGLYNIWFIQPPGRSMFLMDVTDQGEPDVLPVSFAERVENNITYNCFSSLDFGERDRQFVLGSWEKTKPVGKIQPITHLPLFDQEQVQGDFVVITTPQFMNSMTHYLDFQRQRGCKPLLVNVEDIYDCFNFGIKDFEALKRFFKYRYYYMPGPLLRYGLLVGETSDYIGPPDEFPPNGQTDLVPTYGVGLPLMELVHSDTPYTTICGNDDIPDFGLGRFPAATVEDVNAMVKKAMIYDQNLPMGKWKITHAFVTDDEPEFAAIALKIMELFPPFLPISRIFQQDYPYSDLILLWQRKTSIKAKESLLDAINKGVLTLNYFGHGGPNLWTSERLFHISDISLLANQDKMFFLTASTCDTCWLDYPVPPVTKSLGELFVLAPNGGAIAVYGPTTGASPTDHKLLMHGFYEGIFEKGLRNFSEAIIYSKIAFNSERRNKNLMDQFILLGDPSLFFPGVDDRTKILTVPRYIPSGKGGKIAIKGMTKTQPFWGIAHVLIHPPDPEAPFVTFKTHIYEGSFQIDYDVPPDAKKGTYHVSAYAENRFARLEELGHTDFEVASPSVELSLEMESEKGVPIYENTNVIVKPTIKNLSLFPLENILVRLRQTTVKEPILEQKISLQSLQVGNYSLKWKAETGVHALIMEAQLPGESEENMIRKEVFIPVYSTTTPYRVEICPEEIKIDPERPIEGDKPEFTVPLYNLGTIPFYELQLQISLAGVLLGKSKTIKYLKNLQRIEIPFLADIFLPAGNVPLEIRVDALNQVTKKYDELLKKSWSIRVSKAADLVVVPGSISFDSEHFLSGETIFINATVTNVGGRAAENFLVQAYKDKPFVPDKLLEPFFLGDIPKVKNLNPGQEIRVRLRWDNIQSPGKVPIYVVANSNRTIHESNFENNTAMATVVILPHTNLKIDKEKVSFSPDLLQKGQFMNVSFVVENDSDLPAETFDIAFERWGVNLEPESCGEVIRVVGIPQKQSLALSSRWPIDLSRNHFRIKVNSSFSIQETYRHDNEVEFTLDCLDSLKNLDPGNEENSYSFKNEFILGNLGELELNPLQDLYPTNFEDAHGYRFDINPKYVVSGMPPAETSPDEYNDNQWTLKNIWLLASPTEDVPPISFSFPLPDDIQTTICDVYIYVQTLKDYNGYPASKLRLKVEKETQFTTHDFSNQKYPYATVRYLLGRYDLADRFLDVTVADVEERYWTIVNHFEVVPLQSIYKSPVIDIPRKFKGESFILSADSTIPPNTAIEYEYRFGSPGAGNVTWSPWQKLDSSEMKNPRVIDSRYFQWKAYFLCAMDNKPVLKNLVLHIME